MTSKKKHPYQRKLLENEEAQQMTKGYITMKYPLKIQYN